MQTKYFLLFFKYKKFESAMEADYQQVQNIQEKQVIGTVNLCILGIN